MITPIGNSEPEISSENGMPYSIRRWIIFCCGSSAQPVLRIIWRLVAYVVTIMIRTRMRGEDLDVVPLAPRLASSAGVEPNCDGSGTPNSWACVALLNCVSRPPVQRGGCGRALRWRSVWNRPMKTGICKNIGRQPISGLAFSVL